MTDDSVPPETPDGAAARGPANVRTRGDRTSARWVAAGAAMGIGSAALVAALLYANRDRKDAKPAPRPPEHAPESD